MVPHIGRMAQRFRPGVRKLRQPPLNAILTTEMHDLPLLQIVAVAMLILANGFFVAAEFALVSVRDTRIEQLLAVRRPWGSRRAPPAAPD